MKFPIAIEQGNHQTAWGVVVPDLPGCFSAGDSAEEAFANAIEAINAHCEFLAETDKDIPKPRPLSEHQTNQEYAGWVWALVEVDLSKFEGKTEKINITLPRKLLAHIDSYAKAHGKTRSGFIASAVRSAMNPQKSAP